MIEVVKNAEEKMGKAIDALKRDFAAIRAGRANPAILDKIVVDYYGVPTPINQTANISVPEPRLITIQPWDKSIMSDIERAIQKADIGLSPMNDGNVIRLPLPLLTEERRQELVKQARKVAESSRVAIRNIRRDANDDIKKMEKNSELSEDESHKNLDEVQKLTDKFIKQVDELLEQKEEDITVV